MENEIEKKDEAPQQPTKGQLSVVITVNTVGPPEEAEALAKATIRAMKVLCPGVKLGE